jgi:hypothetical protein
MQKAKLLFDELAAAGCPMSLEDFNLYVFRGLRGEFKDLEMSLITKQNCCHMLIFTATFLPMNFCTRTPSIPWLPLPLCCLFILCHSSYHYCQHHSFLLTMLCLITAPTSAIIGVALEVISVPTATITLSRTGANLLQIGSQTTGSRPGATPALGSGLDSSMYAANYAPVLVT